MDKQINRSSVSVTRLRQVTNCCKRVLESDKRVCSNKTGESITFQKPCFRESDKAKLVAEIFSVPHTILYVLPILAAAYPEAFRHWYTGLGTQTRYPN